MIPFNVPPVVGREIEYIAEAFQNNKLSGDGPFNKKCNEFIEDKFLVKKSFLTPSCTASLEFSAILIDIKPGDEVIMPSYTFVSTANAFVLRGARVIFVDIDPVTMNIDPDHIETAISNKTKAIVPVHYAGVGCDMNRIMDIANNYGLYVIEDAAQGVMATYRGRPLGSIGHIGCYSFHETKNYTAGGEGGALLINDESLIHRAEIIREKGTNRSQFIAGTADKYTWHDLGSSFLPSEIQAACLLAQLECAERVNENRKTSWQYYYDSLQPLARIGYCSLPGRVEFCEHNAHMFYLKLNSQHERELLIEYLRKRGVSAVFHYIPLHSSPAGKKFGHFHGTDLYTTADSQRLLRLPMWYGLGEEQQKFIVNCLTEFFEGS